MGELMAAYPNGAVAMAKHVALSTGGSASCPRCPLATRLRMCMVDGKTSPIYDSEYVCCTNQPCLLAVAELLGKAGWPGPPEQQCVL